MDKIYQPDHFQRSAEVLLKLKPFLSHGDNKRAAQELKLSEETVGSYLNGRVRNLDTATRIIVFFKDLIEKRNNFFDPLKGNRNDLVL